MTDRRFTVTIFPDAYAQSLSAKATTLAELHEMVLTTAADQKADLPLLKLAKFGTKRTAQNITLSQSYYYGYINGNGDHRAEIVEGDFIDLRDDLDATARGKKQSTFDDAAQPRRENTGTNKQADPDLVYAAMAVIPNSNDVEWPEWNSMGMACWRATNDHEQGFEAFDMWSAKSSKYDEPTTRERWQRYFTSPPTKIGAGTLFQKADQVQPGWRALVGLPIEKVNEILRLAKLSVAQYDAERKEAAKRLKLRVGTLDDIVDRLRVHATSDDDDVQGTRIEFETLEPWPDAVDGDALIADTVKAIRSHVVLGEHQALAVALWVVHTYAVEVAEHTPRLQIKSPTMRCGKSTLLNVIKPMVAKPINTANITVAALFRLIEMYQPTLLIDEADSFLKRDDGRDNEDMRGIMNGGHKRGELVIRTVGEDFEPRAFKVFGPVAFAWLVKRNINVAPTLEDRSITIELRRRLPEEKIERLRSTRTGHLCELGRRAARWSHDNKLSLADADPELPEQLDDRAQDNWRPLVAIADAISADLGQKARAAALKIAEENIGGGDEDFSIMALADAAAVFELRRREQLPSKDIVDAFVALVDRPWAEWRRGQPLTQNSLARLLKPFGIKPKELRFGEKDTRRGYEAAPIREAKSRFVDAEVTLTEEEVDPDREPL